MKLPVRPVKRSEGFTIIEVLIVLAIAGLIMVVVFLAVPALQRSGRNNALDASVHNVLTAVGNYINNNNGKMPPASGITKSGTTITISGGGSTNSETATVDASVVSLSAIENGGGSAIQAQDSSGPGTIQVVLGKAAKCNDTASGLSGTASGRSYAILYIAESGSGPILKCVGA